MELLEAIKTRKSIRNYKPTAVPKGTLEEILSIASRAPSSMNTQPWEIFVIGGEVLENIKKGNIEKLASGIEPQPDVPEPRFEGEYRRRQVDLAIQIFQLMDITREDKEKRAKWLERGFRFFDAPAAFIICIDKSVNELRGMYDLGSITQTICLTALHFGLGTCIQGQGVMFPDVLRKYAGIPDSKRITESISIGYPDWDFPANKLVSARESLENFVTWRGFD